MSFWSRPLRNWMQQKWNIYNQLGPKQLSKTFTASNRSMSLNICLSSVKALLCLFLASQRSRMQSVGEGFVAKKLMYLSTFKACASILQSLPLGVGGSKQWQSCFLICLPNLKLKSSHVDTPLSVTIKFLVILTGSSGL